MVTKNQVDKLLKKNLTPKEVARLIIEDAEEAVRKKKAIEDIEEELTLSEADTQKLMSNQTQEEAWVTRQWLQAWKQIAMNEAYAQIGGLEAIEFIQTLSSRVREINILQSLDLEERGRPVIMTQKEYEEKKEVLWEIESKEKIPVAEAVKCKADHLFEQETGDFPGKNEKIPEAIYERAQEWVKNLVMEQDLEPKELEEPVVKDEYDFETKGDLDIDDWPFRWYFTQGDLAKAKDSPFSYIKEFDPDRYIEKVEKEPSRGHIPPEVAIIQNPTDYRTDEKGWYNPSVSGYEAQKKKLEETIEGELTDKEYDSLQEFYDTLREGGAKTKIANFKAHQYMASHFYEALGLEIKSSKRDVEQTEERIKVHLMQYRGQLEALRGPRDKAVWHLSSGKKIEFKDIDYETIEPSQTRLKEWAPEVGKYLGEGWLDKGPEDVVINV